MVQLIIPSGHRANSYRPVAVGANCAKCNITAVVAILVCHTVSGEARTTGYARAFPQLVQRCSPSLIACGLPQPSFGDVFCTVSQRRTHAHLYTRTDARCGLAVAVYETPGTLGLHQ